LCVDSWRPRYGWIVSGCAETAEHAAVATLAPENVRGSAFGVLAAVQSIGNLIASAGAGLIYTLVSPAAAFTAAAVLMAVSLVVLTANRAATG
jgi:MFS family permease